MQRRRSFDSDQRLNVLIWLVLIVGGFIVWRLFQKSVIEHPIYAKQAESQYEVSKELPSRRGTIYAQDAERGQIVAMAATEERFDILVVPRNIKDKPAAAKTLSEVFGLDQAATLEAIDNDKLYLPPLVRGATKAQHDLIVEQGFAGLYIEKHHHRVYPENQTAAQLLGFVNRDGQGNYGLEGYYNTMLRGEAGSVVGEKDTLGRIISTIQEIKPKDGASLELTLDHNLEFAIEDRLYQGVEDTQSASGQVIVMDPNDGAILAMAGTPAYDPNKFSEFAQESHRYQIQSIATPYEPGSIMKPVVMASAIDLGKVEPETEETFGSSVMVQGFTIHTALEKAYGRETMTQVLQNSDNVGMVWVAGKMSNDELRAKFVQFGFPDKTGIDLAGESQGSLLPLKDWREIHRATMSFGQGMTATPIQMVRAWAALINGGSLVQPHLVKRVSVKGEPLESPDITPIPGVISPETSAKMRSMLESVVKDGPYGRTRVPGYRIGGKTGTAQIAAESGGYSETDFTHTLIGFFPADQPRFLLLVKLDKPKTDQFAESTAGPIFNDIAKYMFNYYKLPPAE